MNPSTPIRWKPIALLAGIFGLYLLSIRPVPPPEGWAGDFDQAVIDAKATGKNLLVAFNMHGCAPCAMMDKQVMPEPRVRAAIASFVPVRVSLDRWTPIARRYNIVGAPTYLVIRADGTVVNQCSGFIPVEQFLEFLDQASTESVAKPQ